MSVKMIKRPSERTYMCGIFNHYCLKNNNSIYNSNSKWVWVDGVSCSDCGDEIILGRGFCEECGKLFSSPNQAIKHKELEHGNK